MAIRTKQIRREPLPQDVQASAPTSTSGSGTFYTKTIGGVAEAFYIDDLGREIQITSNGAVMGGGGGGGGIASGVNLGTGSGVFAQVSGTSIQFKSLVAGSNVSISASGTELTLSSTGSIASASNSTSGSGAGNVFKAAVGSDLVFKKIKAGANITVTDGADDITIAGSATSGEANTASNSVAGTGAGQVFKEKSGVDLVFKKIKAGANITVSDGTDDITIAAAAPTGEANTASNLGVSGEGVFAQKIGVDLQFKKIIAGTNIGLSSSSTGITISSTATGEANTAANVGASGVGVFKQKSGVSLQFKNIAAGSSKVTVVDDVPNSNVVLDVADNTSTQKVVVSKAGTSIGTRKQINFIEGSNVTITTSDNAGSDRVDVTIAASGGGGGGSGEVIQDVQFGSLATGYVTLRVYGLAADISAISVSKITNAVTISNVLGTAKIMSITARFDASDISAGTASISYPEPSAQTSLTTSSFPTVVRFTAAGAQQTTAFSMANTSGTMTLSCSSLTNAATNYVKVVF
jgi:hypothetical protein